jgi:arylsulfatase
LVYSFEDSKAASKHTIQHYYIFGSRSIYANGWKAEAAHHPDNVDFDFKPGETIADKSFDEDVWSLYNLNDDFNERIDLAKKYPDKLAELQKLFDIQATKYNLYPLIDWYDVNNKRIHHPNGSDTQGPIK